MAVAVAVALSSCGGGATDDAREGDEAGSDDTGASDSDAPDLLVEIGPTLYAGHSRTQSLTPLPLPHGDPDDEVIGCMSDSRTILRTFTVGDETQLRMVDLDTMTEKILPVPADFGSPYLFPDRSAIAGDVRDETSTHGYTRQLTVIATDTGDELWRTGTTDVIETVLSVSPDGQWVAVSFGRLEVDESSLAVGETSLQVFPSMGGDSIEFSVSEDLRMIDSAQWFSDSRRLLVAASDGVRLVDLVAQTETTIAEAGRVRLSPDETKLAHEVWQPIAGPTVIRDIELWLPDPWRRAGSIFDAGPEDVYELRGWSADSAFLLAEWHLYSVAENVPAQWRIVDADGTSERTIFEQTPYGAPTNVHGCDLSAL